MAETTRRSPDPAPHSAPNGARLKLTYQRGSQRWTFHWSAGDERAVFEALIELATKESGCFDWFDAAAVSHGIGQAVLDSWSAIAPATPSTAAPRRHA